MRPLINLEPSVVEALLPRVIAEEWSARRIEQWISSWKQENKAQKNSAPKSKSHLQAVEQLSTKFHSSVDIRTNTRGAGKIIIPFKDDADFERIRSLLG